MRYELHIEYEDKYLNDEIPVKSNILDAIDALINDHKLNKDDLMIHHDDSYIYITNVNKENKFKKFFELLEEVLFFAYGVIQYELHRMED